MFFKVKKGLGQYQNKKVKYFKTFVAVLQFFNEPFIFLILCACQRYKRLNFIGVLIIPLIRKRRMLK